VVEAAVETAEWLRGVIAARAAGVELLGPAPAPLARLKGRWRWHLVLRSAHRSLLGRVARYAARRAPHGRGGAVRLVVDRDPVTLL
jgi:primosomal protein N' (replication factor Y)